MEMSQDISIFAMCDWLGTNLLLDQLFLIIIYTYIMLDPNIR